MNISHTPSKRPRICLISERLTPPFDEGFKNVARHLIRAFHPHYPTLGLTYQGQDIPNAHIRNVRTNRLFLTPSMRKALRDFAPDVIYYLPTASTTPASFFRAKILAGWAPAAKVVFVGLQPRPVSVAHSFLRFLSPDLLVAVSPRILETLPRLPCPQALLPLGVDTERFCPGSSERKQHLRPKYGLASETPVLLHVGHVKEERNIQWLAHLQKQQGIQTLLVGSTSTHTEKVLVARLEQCGVRVVTNYMDIVEAYHLADGYLFPTRNEMAAIGIPLSVLEAMACNLAVLATPFGGLPTFFPARPDQGLFYADTPASFATQIPDLLTVQPRTREMVLPFQWTHIARRILVVTQQELAMDWGL